MYLEINQAMLISLAGEDAYNQGAKYYRKGAVKGFRQSKSLVTAQVADSELYTVTLRHTAQILDGSCNCPVSDGFDFCKHCVAVALHIKQQQAKRNKLIAGDEQDRILAYLLDLDKEELAQSLFEVIRKDSTLRSDWQLKAELALGRLDEKALRKRITAVTRGKAGLYRHSAVRIFFRAMLPEVALLNRLVGKADGAGLSDAELLKLIVYFYRRLALALEKVDDSGGYRAEVQFALQELHLQVLGHLDWSKEKIAEHLLSLKLEDAIDSFEGIPQSYESILGEEGLSVFYEKAFENWQKLSAKEKKSKANVSNSNLAYLLKEYAQANNDLSIEIAIYAGSADSAFDLAHLAGLYLKQGDAAAAQSCVDAIGEGSSFEKRHKLESQAQIYLHSGDKQAAKDEMLAYFYQAATPDAYQKLRALYAAEDRAALLESVVQGINQSSLLHSQGATAKGNLLVQVAMIEADFALAWQLAESHAVPRYCLLDLARESANFDVYKARAISVFKKEIAKNLENAVKASYLKAIDLIGELQTIFGVQQKSAFNDYMRSITMEHQNKKSFLKLLSSEFDL